MIWKPHPKQLEFLNDDRPKIFIISVPPHSGNWLKKFFIESRIRMEGVVRNIPINKGYGFIKTDNSEYFFHRDDFNGHWQDLEKDFHSSSEAIKVTFEPIQDSPKGPRAQFVTRLDWPNN